GCAEKGSGKDGPSDQRREVARCGGLGGGSADVRAFAVAWQYQMADCRSDPVDGCLGVVQRSHPDRSLCRSPSVVARRPGTGRPRQLSRPAQGAGALDGVLAAGVVGALAPADAGTGAQALAGRAVAGAGGRWLARQRAPHPGKRAGFLCPSCRHRQDDAGTSLMRVVYAVPSSAKKITWSSVLPGTTAMTSSPSRTRGPSTDARRPTRFIPPSRVRTTLVFSRTMYASSSNSGASSADAMRV